MGTWGCCGVFGVQRFKKSDVQGQEEEVLVPRIVREKRGRREQETGKERQRQREGEYLGTL